MESNKNIRKKLIERIRKLSDDKLKSVDSYIDELEEEIQNKQSIMEFEGIFEDLDSEFFNGLTSDLHKQRKVSNTRIP